MSKRFVQTFPVSQRQPKSPVAEAYRTLRTNLGFASIDNTYRTIMLTSPNPQDGKSTTVSNLAVTMAQAGNRTLLVDCDLRKPTQHRIFQVSNTQGITNCLLQQLDVEQIAHHNVIDNLSILTSGPIPPNPAELLAADRTRSFWPQLLEKYDTVLVDAPPVIAVADASILASQLDGVILVVRSAHTRIDFAQNAKVQLEKANAHIIGVVLNDLNMESKDYQYYYYYSSSGSSEHKKSIGLTGLF